LILVSQNQISPAENTPNSTVTHTPHYALATHLQSLFIVARPCTKDGQQLSEGMLPSSGPSLNPGNPFFPFNNRHDFDWAEHYFKDLGASKRQIGKGLDIWLSSTLQSNSKAKVPWKNAKDMYAAIDQIQQGGIPWNMVKFKYNKPTTSNSPHWMQETYELCYRDVRLLLQSQLANPEFKDHFDYEPYQEFGQDGDRFLSNFMSGDWAWLESVSIPIKTYSKLLKSAHLSKDVISEDPNTHGSMLVPVISGSDKTTVSVATGHQEYHPVYISAGNISNTARRSQGGGILPAAILPIPKGM